MRINIRGVIVDSTYDEEYLYTYISRGVITPESYFRKQLDTAARSNESADVLISSYGGNVIAGNDMLIAFKEFAGEKSVTVGAFAASMAANFVLNCGVDVKCYKNSQFLFHGASCVTYGGADAMEDSADWLTKINESIIEALVAKGIPEERVREGFAEGREMILTADEALEFGIVSKIIDADAAPLDKITTTQTNQLVALGMPDVAVAAVVSDVDTEAELNAKIAQAAAELEALKNDLEISQGESRKVQSAADKRVQQIQNELDSLRAEHENNLRALETSNALVESLQQQLDAVNSSHSKLVGGVLLDSGEASQSWQQLVQRYGYAEAARRYPAKAEAFRKNPK